MKKLLLCGITALCMTSTACGICGGEGGKVQVDLRQPFVVDAKVTVDQTQAEASLSRYGDQAWDVTFSQPDSLAGVQLAFLDGQVTASYKGLSFSVPQSAMPVKSMLTIFIDLVGELDGKTELDCVKEGDTCVVEGSVEQGSYTLTLDQKGIPLKFEMPNQKLVMELSNFRQTDAPDGTESASEPAVTDTTEPEQTSGTETAAQ